ncbi:MAG: RluA family pseudouridine synthase [Candidatus Promineifilaceae bacterium]
MSERMEVISLDRPGERLDKALAERLPELSRAQLQRLIRDGLVTLAGAPLKASFRLAGGEQVVVERPEIAETGLAAEALPLDIRYEDRDILVINKPAGMVVHPSVGHEGGTLVNAVLGYCPDIAGIGGERRPGIVHRLDKETSGLILVAKNDAALTYLQDQFRERKVEKRYLALVEGHFGAAEALIDAPIGRHPQERKRMAVIPPGSAAIGRPAQTHVRVLTRYQDFTLLECRPRTGRTHQIRVHLAFAGHPLAGDTSYGRRKRAASLARQFLHAAGLRFRRPADRREVACEAELPADLARFLESLASQYQSP